MAEGVRSFSEVCMHDAMAGCFSSRLVGVKAGAALDKGVQRITGKAKVVFPLTDSLPFTRKVIRERGSSLEKAPRHRRPRRRTGAWFCWDSPATRIRVRRTPAPR